MKNNHNAAKAAFFSLFLFTLFFLSLAMPCRAGMQSAHYKISQSVLSSGGGVTQSASYVNHSTLGQPTPLGTADSGSGSYTNSGGFWQSVATIINNYPKALSWLMLLLDE